MIVLNVATCKNITSEVPQDKSQRVIKQLEDKMPTFDELEHSQIATIGESITLTQPSSAPSYILLRQFSTPANPAVQSKHKIIWSYSFPTIVRHLIAMAPMTRKISKIRKQGPTLRAN